jgi:hypothetical protein
MYLFGFYFDNYLNRLSKRSIRIRLIDFLCSVIIIKIIKKFYFTQKSLNTTH